MMYHGHTWKSRARRVIHSLFRIPIPPWHCQQVKLYRSRKLRMSYDDLLRGVTDAFPNLSYVSEFIVRGWSVRPPYNMRTFFDSAWSALGHGLRKLSLDREVETLYEVLRSSPYFPLLQEFNLSLTSVRLPRIKSTDDALLCGVAAPFINRHRSTLRTLSITSLCSLDLSAFFHALDRFSILDRFSLHFGFDLTFRSDSSGLTCFLREHAKTLTRIELITGPSAPIQFVQNDYSTGFKTWIIQNTSEPALFGQLTSLTISSVHQIDFASIMSHISRSADTLTELSVCSRCLTLEEVNSLVTIFALRPPSNGLQSLRINISEITFELIHLLASRLPGLQKLCLYTEIHIPRVSMPSAVDGCLGL
jgi:hypothetical protein